MVNTKHLELNLPKDNRPLGVERKLTETEIYIVSSIRHFLGMLWGNNKSGLVGATSTAWISSILLLCDDIAGALGA